MNLRYIKISELNELCTSSEYASWNHVPISPARARSQALNPYALPGDVALIIAINEEINQVVGFIGALPSKLNNENSRRVVWVSNWWVEEGQRGKGIAKILLKNLIDAWGDVLAFQDLTVPTLKIIQTLGLFYPMEKKGLLLYIRPGLKSRLKVLLHSARKLRIPSWILFHSGLAWLADFIANMLLLFLQRFQLTDGEIIKPVKLLFPGEKDVSFSQNLGKKDFHIPALNELQMPSWLEKPTKSNFFLSKKYDYSSFADSFESFWLRWDNNGETLALLMVTLRDGVMKIPYVYCKEEFRLTLPKEMLRYCFKDFSIRTLMTTQPILVEEYSKRNHFILKRKEFTRFLAVSNSIMNLFNYEPNIQDGDGDYHFT